MVQRLDAAIRLLRVRYPPGQNPAEEPARSGHQLSKALAQRQLSVVGAKDLNRPNDSQPAKHVVKGRVPLFRLAGVGFLVGRDQKQGAHQPPDTFFAHCMIIVLLAPFQLANTVKRRNQEQTIPRFPMGPGWRLI